MNDTTPLGGLRVIDLTHAFAGPFATYHLGLMGAEVIKVEAPGGDEFRHWRAATFAQANAGKQSVVIDLKTPQGLAVLMRLVATADVLIENLRPGAAAKLGIHWEALSAANPRLIFCSVSGYGQQGELRDRPAMEWSVQALSGVNALYVDADAPATTLGLSILDPFAGYMAFAAVMAAVLQRQKTGTGQRVDISMFDAAWVLNASSVTDILRGDTPVSMVARPNSARYRCRDKRLFISFIWPKWFTTLSEVIGAPGLASDPRFADPAAMRANGDALVAEVEARLATRNAAEWAEVLSARGVPASPVDTIAEAAQWPQVRQRGLLQQVTASDSRETFDVVGSGIVLGHDQPTAAASVPAVGEHTLQVLRAAGFCDAELAELRACAAIVIPAA